MVNGKPVIAAFDFNNQDLEYFRSSSANGTVVGDWAFHETVDGLTTSAGWNCEILQVDGKPAIGYRNLTNTEVKYAIRY